MKLLRLSLTLFLAFCFLFSASTIQAAPQIENVTLNLNSIPRYDKLELTFDITRSAASRPQWPYDPAPPPGVPPGLGITVTGLFLPPGQSDWTQAYPVPGFYYQIFDDQTKGYQQDWYYPTNVYHWKVRFGPNQTGTWQYRLTAQDSSGTANPISGTFEVTPSSDPGFIRVSPSDRRYFEFEDGTYFNALGYNNNFNRIDWINPERNEPNFQAMQQNHVNFIRNWLSQWNIWGDGWSAWMSNNPVKHSYYPGTATSFEQAYPGSDVSLKLETVNPEPGISPYNCMVYGLARAHPAVIAGATYRITLRYKNVGVRGPLVAGQPYGLVLKRATSSLWHDTDVTKRCNYPGTGTLITPHASQSTTDWQTVSGDYLVGPNEHFLDLLLLTLENTTAGDSFIDHLWVQRVLPDGSLDPVNVIYHSWMANHLYFSQRDSYAFDKIIDLAKKYNVYLKLVTGEKDDHVLTQMDFNGHPLWQSPGIPDRNQKWFYGELPGELASLGYSQTLSKSRWLQQSWWRYIQARWGYSTQIHSFEAQNEGSPEYNRHFNYVDKAAQYFKCSVFGQNLPDSPGSLCSYQHPNRHLVSSSTWYHFSKDNFFDDRTTATATAPHGLYPNVDFADVHQYTGENQGLSLKVYTKQPAGNISLTTIPVMPETDYPGAAIQAYNLSQAIGALAPFGTGKPVIRGEMGYTSAYSSDEPLNLIPLVYNGPALDPAGIALHQTIWAGLNPGGMIDLTFYEYAQIYDPGDLNPDLRYHFRHFADFMTDITLSNGRYVDAQAVVSNPTVRAWGQKDTAAGRVHLWVQNSAHSWTNPSPAPQSATVTLTGLTPNAVYPIEWWNTYTGAKTSDTVHTAANGSLVLQVNQLITDVAIKIGNYSAAPAPSPSPPPNPDYDLDGDTDWLDFSYLVRYFGNPFTLFDLNRLINFL